jgi:hypothetical protein
MVSKPVPVLDAVITEIMDVVWIEDVVEFEKAPKIDEKIQTTLLDDPPKKKQDRYITKSSIIVVNYKKTPQKFNLYALIPEDAVVGTVSPKPAKRTPNYIQWKLESIPSTSKVDIYFELAGLAKGDFDENDLYVENINPSYVIGAEKWEGE